MCVARRLPPIKPAGRIFNWSVFRNSAFSVYCTAQFVLSFGVFIGLSPPQATSIGPPLGLFFTLT
ncbi:hypothetical protein B0H19DRAFT_1041037 [Mycena capillaripes]|nr:hypothetical protein B0H19DRAFT_1041037 [Mycena capillaripes]